MSNMSHDRTVRVYRRIVGETPKGEPLRKSRYYAKPLMQMLDTIVGLDRLGYKKLTLDLLHVSFPPCPTVRDRADWGFLMADALKTYTDPPKINSHGEAVAIPAEMFCKLEG